MTKDFKTINQLIHDGRVDESISRLNVMALGESVNDEIYFLLGNAYAKLGNWPQAIYNYNLALELNPVSPASEALEQIQAILDFYNTDLYNP